MRFVLILAVVCLASPAYSASPLLVEFGWNQRDPVTLPANYGLLIGDGPWNGTDNGIEVVTTWPTMFTGSQAAIDHWNFWNLSAMGAGTSLDTSFFVGSQQPLAFGGPNLGFILGGFDGIWNNGDETGVRGPTQNGVFHATTHVPQLGEGLNGYWITGIERIITAEGQTMRIFGHSIPEPASVVLVLLATHCCVSRRCCRRVPGRRSRHSRRSR